MRYLALVTVFVLLALAAWASWFHSAWWLAALAPLMFLSAAGIYDLLQPQSTLRRNYPLLAHLRFFLESIGPELRQYFVQADLDEVPFSRAQRSLVYSRAKKVSDVVAFGTLGNVYGESYEWINHSLAPVKIADPDFRIRIGGPECKQPYDASVFNVSAMSFGALSAAAVRSLSSGAALGGFYVDTGEGSVSPYHLEGGGDLVWELGTGYFGCRTEQGGFDAEKFRVTAANPQIRMIEIKLSQGAKPGKGGVLPGAKVSPEIAATRGVPVGVDCISPASHSAFSTPIGLLEFVQQLRELSGGKPVGFKLCIGHPWEWFAIVKAMVSSQILPDFIVVDGAEGGTGAAPAEFIDHVGVPMHEGLLLVHNTLVGAGLRTQIRLGAAGRITSAFEMAKTMALGADWCNGARSFMLSLGCIQSLSCHTDHCPTGVATQDPRRWKHLDVTDKSQRVFNYHQATVHALAELLSAAGLSHPQELGPEHVLRRISPTEVRAFDRIYNFIAPGSLLGDNLPEHDVLTSFWQQASADSFLPPRSVMEHRKSREF